MAEQSKIEWTDATWNPTRGCDKIAPGCAHCYAERFAERFRGVPGHPYERGFDPRLAPDKLLEPLRWKISRRIFVDSMSDLFHEAFPFDYIDACFAVMALAPQHTFQILTKRPSRAAKYFAKVAERAADPFHDGTQKGIDRGAAEVLYGLLPYIDGGENQTLIERARERRALPIVWPLPNVWIGTSIANQTDAEKNIPHLLRLPATVRFLSIEPLLGPVDLSRWIAPRDAWQAGHLRCCPLSYPEVRSNIFTGGCGCLHWIIAGGESGPGARPCNVEWIRSIVAQSAAAGVPCFVKQLGAKPRLDTETRSEELILRDRKGGDMDQWPADLRVREFPKAAA
jgi:protein gp37